MPRGCVPSRHPARADRSRRDAPDRRGSAAAARLPRGPRPPPRAGWPVPPAAAGTAASCPRSPGPSSTARSTWVSGRGMNRADHQCDGCLSDSPPGEVHLNRTAIRVGAEEARPIPVSGRTARRLIGPVALGRALIMSSGSAGHASDGRGCLNPADVSLAFAMTPPRCRRSSRPPRIRRPPRDPMPRPTNVGRSRSLPPVPMVFPYVGLGAPWRPIGIGCTTSLPWSERRAWDSNPRGARGP